MSEDSHEQASDEDAERTELASVQRAVDDLRVGSPVPRPARPRPVEPEALPEAVRQRITEGLEGVAYVQHAYTSDELHVCHVGIREEATIREDVVVAGPKGVARLEEIQQQVDELRRGADPSDVAGLLS